MGYSLRITSFKTSTGIIQNFTHVWRRMSSHVLRMDKLYHILIWEGLSNGTSLRGCELLLTMSPNVFLESCMRKVRLSFSLHVHATALKKVTHANIYILKARKKE